MRHLLTRLDQQRCAGFRLVKGYTGLLVAGKSRSAELMKKPAGEMEEAVCLGTRTLLTVPCPGAADGNGALKEFPLQLAESHGEVRPYLHHLAVLPSLRAASM